MFLFFVMYHYVIWNQILHNFCANSRLLSYRINHGRLVQASPTFYMEHPIIPSIFKLPAFRLYFSYNGNGALNNAKKKKMQSSKHRKICLFKLYHQINCENEKIEM